MKKSELIEIIREELDKLYSEERDYKREYELYHSKPKQKKRRAQRNAARRKMERGGKVSKGDGKDVHHRNKNTADNSSSNLAIMNKRINRAIK